MKTVHIYKIENLTTGKLYIGSTCNKTKRKSRHFELLKANNHHSKKLQNSFNKHGRSSFKFKVIESLKISDIKEQFEREQYYIDYYASCTKGYNMSCTAHTPVFDIIWTDEMKKAMGRKVSEKHKGKTPKNIELMRSKQKRAIEEYENGILVREYESAREAGRVLGFCYKAINNVLTGRTKHCRSFPNKIWKYKDGKGIRKVKQKNKQ